MPPVSTRIPATCTSANPRLRLAPRRHRVVNFVQVLQAHEKAVVAEGVLDSLLVRDVKYGRHELRGDFGDIGLSARLGNLGVGKNETEMRIRRLRGRPL